MPAPLPLKLVNHVGFVSKRVDESRTFYRDVLGFREVARPNFSFRGAWLYNYGIMIHIIDSQLALDPTGEIETRGNHLAIHTDELETVERLLNEHQIPYRKNYVPDIQVTQFFFRDPDGHHIEVATYPPLPPFLDGPESKT